MFFQQASPFGKALTAPVRIVAFASESEYRPYHPSESAASFYAHDPEHDYIVMQDLDPGRFNYAIHEYTHLVIARSGLRIPLWMNEGWADLNSTLTAKGRRAMIGDVIAGRRDALLQKPWVPLADLDKIAQDSPLYNEREKASVFYGESWALAHMLFLAPEYRKKFDVFVQATLAGKGIADACLAVYGKPASQVQEDLARYISGNKLNGAVFDVKLDAVEETTAVSPVDAVDASLLLADLLTLTHRFADSQRALQNLSSEYPKNPKVQAALGYLAIETGDQAAGIGHLRQAFDLGSTDAVMCYRLAVLLHATSADRGAAITILRRAIELNQDFADARLQLGITLLESQDYAGSLSELRLIPKITEAHALWYFAATAIDNAKLGHSEEARKNADLARKWAKTPAQVSEVEQIFHQLDASK